MKRTIITWFLVIGIVVTSIWCAGNAEAQPETERERIVSETYVTRLEELASEFEERYQVNKARALEVAREKGWIIRQEMEDGRLIELQRINEFGMPVYYVTNNRNAADTISTDEVHPGGSAGLSLTGSGMTIGEWDGGGVLTTHQEFGSPSRVTQQDSPGGTHYHATHVAGTLVAGGVEANARGMVSQASLDAYDWNSDSSEMTSAASGGLLVSNHSYGSIAGWFYNSSNGYDYWYGTTSISWNEDWKFGFYNSTAQSWDQIAVNAPYYLIVKSAGNDRNDVCSGSSCPGHYVWGGSFWTWSTYNHPQDGGTTGYDSIPTAGNAKNILTVGAVHDISGGYTQPSDVVMSSFSGWGPTDDGRIKPDICGNGISLFSTDDDANNDYTILSGTSMSAPNVAGSLLLLQQHYNNLHSNSMRSATLKALVIHTADEAGSNNGPDYMYGWGLMNTANAAGVISQRDTTTYIDEETLNNGGTYTLNVTTTGTDPLVATLVWTDPAGTPPAAALDPVNRMLVNDLDMRITRNTSTYFPWRLDPATPAAAATTGDNDRDNVEKIEIANPVAGQYTFTVTHKGTLQGGDQDFSLIVSGMTGQALPNDHLANATTITAVPFSANQSTVGATLEASEVAGSCYSSDNSSVWFQYTVAANGTLNIETCGSDFDTTLTVWTGTGHPLTQVACNDDDSSGAGLCGGGQVSSLSLAVTASTTYYIRVAEYGSAPPASMNLDFDLDFVPDTTLCGSISGTLTAANSPYTVTCDIQVDAGQSLVIESGVVLNGLDNYSFTVNGQLTWYP